MSQVTGRAPQPASPRLFHVRIPPLWEESGPLRERCIPFLAEAGVDRDGQDAISMVVCELSENATKYGDFARDETIGVTVSVDRTTITVEVRHPVVRGSIHVTRLDETTRWIRSFPTPLHAYLERLQQIASGGSSSESRLGLARIAYEAQSELSFRIEGERELVVRAQHRRADD